LVGLNKFVDAIRWLENLKNYILVLIGGPSNVQSFDDLVPYFLLNSNWMYQEIKWFIGSCQSASLPTHSTH